MNGDKTTDAQADVLAKSDYGSNGIIGVLTPQANTTVEPELWSLLPSGWSMLNARLTSAEDTIEKRLLDYTGNYISTAQQFANAPLTAIAIACTGTSYLLSDTQEKAIVAAIEQRHEIPCITAAQATVGMLREMDATTIAVLTPYPDSLNEVSTKYWQSQGFEIIEKTGPGQSDNAFHPIYAMSGNAVCDAYERLAETDADVVLMLGTGMPTLGPILTGAERQMKPALSCNLALARAVVNAACGGAEVVSLEDWLSGSLWRERYCSILG